MAFTKNVIAVIIEAHLLIKESLCDPNSPHVAEIVFKYVFLPHVVQFM